jgi:UDP-3-O-[3-hydroxymyristoyl] glucosamine N-acyltransferase
MADPKFFHKQPALSLARILEISGGRLAGSSETMDRLFDDVAPLDVAGETHISFLDNIRYKDSFMQSKAGLCIVSENAVAFAPKDMVLVVSANPYKAYALVAQALYPDAYPVVDISPAAHIHPSAILGQGCVVEAGAVVKENAVIGDGCWIESCAVIGRGVQIGAKCRIGTGASVSHAILGQSVRLYPGVRVGQDGFGFAIDPKGHVKVPQLGRVLIEDHVEIGANTTIDRGSGPDTLIGAGTWIDNQVQIGHNVKIGKGCVLVAQCGVAGSTVLEDYVVLAAKVGVAGHLRLGRGARIGAMAGVMRDVPAGEEQLGAPSMPVRDFMRQVATLKRLTKPRKSE